jgi:hypothetical protein
VNRASPSYRLHAARVTRFEKLTSSTTDCIACTGLGNPASTSTTERPEQQSTDWKSAKPGKGVAHGSGSTMTDLADLQLAGYVIDEWSRWQQGYCGTYATALIQAVPGLRLGCLDGGHHFTAHDDEFAYDSAGRHPLPYQGVRGDMTWQPDAGPPSDWGLPDDECGPEGPDEALAAALEHAARNNIHPALTPRPTGPRSKEGHNDFL